MASVEAEAHVRVATAEDVRREVRAALAEHGGLQKPVPKKLRGAEVVPDPTDETIVRLGSPGAGRWWDVRHVRVASAADPIAAFSGTALVCIGQMTLDQARDGTALDPFEVWAIITAAPLELDWGEHQATVIGTESLYVVFSGTTAGNNVNAHALVWETTERSRYAFQE